MPFQAGAVHEVKANLFRVLGHPARVRILELLRDGERSVGALQAELGLDSGGTSQHLAALRRIGLVASRREGNERLLPRRRDGGVRPARGRPGDHQPTAGDGAVDPARARGRVTAALLLAGRGAARASAARPRADAARVPRRRSCVQAAGAALLAVAGFWALAAGTTVGAGVHERVHAALRRRRPERRSSSGCSALVAAPTLAVRIALPRARTARPRRSAVLTGAVRAHARRGALRARPADVPRGLGADDAAAGGADPRRRAPTRRRGGRSSSTSRSRTSRGAGTWVAVLLAAHAGVLDGAHARARLRRSRSRSRWPRSSAWGRRPA